MTLHDEISSGKIAAVKRYIAAGQDLEARDALKRTPLLVATERGQVAIARLLLDKGADPFAVDYRKFTPLHRAAGMGTLDIVQALLEAGSDPRAKNAFESTPLHELAAGAGTPSAAKIAERLLEAGAPLDAVDSSGCTALWRVAATGTQPLEPPVMKARLAVLKLLLERGADPTLAADGTQGTPLDAAHGRHQQKKYRIVWPEAIALLEELSAKHSAT